MSDIERNLETILSATYGRDVRQAIHDSIHDCYEDGKAGSTDLVAREQYNSLVADLGGNRDETDLWTGTAYLPETEISLSDEITEFDYLDFYYGISVSGESDLENLSIKRVKAEETNLCTFNFFNIEDNVATRTVNAYEMELEISEDTLTIIGNRVWYWSGNTGDSATKDNAKAADDIKFTLVKVVGIKFTADSEVADIRIGEDGTTYASAGEAVRTQISDLKSQIESVSSVDIYVEGNSLVINTELTNGNEVSF